MDRGLIILPGAVNHTLRDSIIQLAAAYRLPAIYPLKYYAKDGGLLYYGIDQADQWPKAAGYVDRILRGAKPSDLPVQAATRYELAINLKTAKALGLAIPPTLLARADGIPYFTWSPDCTDRAGYVPNILSAVICHLTSLSYFC